jgi:hypothetical protein
MAKCLGVERPDKPYFTMSEVRFDIILYFVFARNLLKSY